MVLGDAASKLKTFVWILNYVFKSVTCSLIDQKASYLDRWRRIQNMDPRSMDHPCGAGPWTPSWARSGVQLWTTPHFTSRKIFGRKREVILTPIWTTWEIRQIRKIQVAPTGFEPMTSVMPVQRSTNWALKPLSWEQVNLLGSFVPVKDSMIVMNLYLKSGS